MKELIAERLARVKETIAEACARAGRDPAEVTLIAVTKTIPADVIQAAISAGVEHIGENRVQEARDKFPHVPAGVVRHLIGHLQTNKARYIPGLFDWVHSLDRIELAQALGKRAQREGRTIDCLIQVNVSGEETKHGVAPERALELVEQVAEVEGLRVRGLMTMAPLTGDTGLIRWVFASLRSLSQEIEKANIPGVSMEHLSMGMSNDFPIAIEEGATMIRVGSAIFGPRT